jgi:hypothetical protein
MKKNLLAATLFAAAASVALLGGCGSDKCTNCQNKDAAAMGSGEAKAGEATPACCQGKDAKAANAAESTGCTHSCTGDKSANSAEATGCSHSCTGSKTTNN